MFSKIEEVNQLWLTEKESFLADVQALIAGLSLEDGLMADLFFERMRALAPSLKNTLYKNIIFLKWLNEVNKALLQVYESRGVWENNVFQNGLVVLNKAIQIMDGKRDAFLSFPCVDGISVINQETRLFLDQVSELTDITYDFEIDEAQWRSHLSDALNVIQLDPASFVLVRNFVSYIVPLKRQLISTNLSFSTRSLPNVIFKNDEGSAYLFGETLVHEADHQFFYVLEKIGSFWQADVREQKPVYYSPWRDDPRPLDGIIRGASAFTRVCRYYAAVIKNVPDKEINTVGELLSLKLLQCEGAIETLVTSGQLSVFGNEYVREMNLVLQQAKETIQSLTDYPDWACDAVNRLNAHQENWKKVNPQFNTPKTWPIENLEL